MIILNLFKEVYGFGSDLVKVFFFFDGLLVWIIMQFFEVICDVNVKYYFFDKQFCLIRFGIYSFDRNWLNIIFLNFKIDMFYYEENGLWEIENIVVYSIVEYGLVEVVYEIYMKC